METTDAKLARIDENVKNIVKLLDEKIPDLIKRTDRHRLEIALMKRDQRWGKGIALAIGSIIGFLHEWLRK